MSKYSPVFKRDVVQKILQRKGQKIDEVAKEHGVGRATVFRWLSEHLSDPQGLELRAARPQDWSVAAKTKALLETSFMNEQEVGVYLRANGLYHCHLKDWKGEVLGVMGRNRKLNRVEKEGAEPLLRQRIKDLQRELRLKEKALREATALLALKKKAELIWADQEAEKSLPTTEESASSSSRKQKPTDAE